MEAGGRGQLRGERGLRGGLPRRLHQERVLPGLGVLGDQRCRLLDKRQIFTVLVVF